MENLSQSSVTAHRLEILKKITQQNTHTNTHMNTIVHVSESTSLDPFPLEGIVVEASVYHCYYSYYPLIQLHICPHAAIINTCNVTICSIIHCFVHSFFIHVCSKSKNCSKIQPCNEREWHLVEHNIIGLLFLETLLILTNQHLYS